MSPDVGAEFREFAGGFADPLGRLAYVLVAGSSRDDADDHARVDALVVQALARTLCSWHEVHSHGTPEAIAVGALLDRLPRGSTAAMRSAGAGVAAAPDAAQAADASEAADIEAARQALWLRWCALEPRHRVPLVFADPGLIVERLRNLDVPETFASARRLDSWEQRATDALSVTWSQLVEARPRLSRHNLPGVLAETLRTRAAGVPAPFDVAARATAAARSIRSRNVAVGVAAAAVAAGVVATLVVVSGGGARQHATTAGATPGPTPGPTASSSLGSASASASSAPGPQDVVVDWPMRGSASADNALLYNLRLRFLAAHPDATGPLQVLLATDTARFRVAYVTARTPADIVGSWFYGPVGADDLSEGAATSERAGDPVRPVAAVVLPATGEQFLVVVGPPGGVTARVTFAGAGSSIRTQQFAATNGVVVAQVSDLRGPSISVTFGNGTQTMWTGAGSVSWLSTLGMASTPDRQGILVAGALAGLDPLSPSSVVVQRGAPDRRDLDIALRALAVWEGTGQLGDTVLPTILWAGPDGAGGRALVLRAKTLGLAPDHEDLVIIIWSGQLTGEGEYVTSTSAPDYPFAFLYDGTNGGRIGVLGAADQTSASLLFDDEAQAGADFDPNGFASMPVTGSFTSLGAQDFVVVVRDAAGRIVTSLPVPPSG